MPQYQDSRHDSEYTIRAVDRVCDLSRHVRPHRTAKVPIGIVAQVEVGVGHAQILRPQPAPACNLGLKALETEADR